MVSGPVPSSGAERRGKVLDEVSTAIPGDEVAGNMKITGLSGEFFWLGISIVLPESALGI
jgi:hypothetical protein